MPTVKLQVQDDKLPIDMATERGATSKSSVGKKYIYILISYLILYLAIGYLVII